MTSTPATSKTTVTSAGLRICAEYGAAELEPGVFVDCRRLPDADRHEPVEGGALRRYQLDGCARFACKFGDFARPFQHVRGIAAFPASLSPPSSADKTTTFPFFGVAILAKLIVGLAVIECPVGRVRSSRRDLDGF